MRLHYRDRNLAVKQDIGAQIPRGLAANSSLCITATGVCYRLFRSALAKGPATTDRGRIQCSSQIFDSIEVFHHDSSD
jgi:hypothetical protein